MSPLQSASWSSLPREQSWHKNKAAVIPGICDGGGGGGGGCAWFGHNMNSSRGQTRRSLAPSTMSRAAVSARLSGNRPALSLGSASLPTCHF